MTVSTVSWSSPTYNDFTVEAHRVDEMIWAGLGIEPQMEVLFCGFSNAESLIKRAKDLGAIVTVIDSTIDGLRAAAQLGVETVRASTTGIPIRNDRFSLAVAHHYLHEVDPNYHTQIIFELGRVARRIAIVEPGPPSDLLGSRIASLYSRAKRRLGQFEQYQGMEYWRRLLIGVRSHVSPTEIRYAHLPPTPFLHDTIRVVLESMRIAGAPEDDLRALEGVASASDIQLIPQPRYLLLAGITAGDIPDRPRFTELQKQAPTRLSLRRPDKTSKRETPSHTYSPASVAKPARKLGLPWLNQPPAETATSPSATSLALPIGPPHKQHLPIAQPIGAAMAPLAFGAMKPSPEKPSGFGFDEDTADTLDSMFSVPAMPGSESMDWSDSEDVLPFGKA